MVNKQTLDSILSGPDAEVYSAVTNAALYIATGGFLEQANQLLSELWKYQLPHDRNTWLADTAFMVLWHAAGSHPDFIPFPLDNIDTIEKNIRGYIAVDKWGYKIPDKPSNELTGQDLLRKAFITAAMVKGDGSDHFPSSGTELEALVMLEKLAGEKIIFCEGFALGAELAAKNGRTATAIQFAKRWASGYHEGYLSYIFQLLSCGRHVAPLLLQKQVAAELKLSDSIVHEFVLQAIAMLDRRF